MTEIDRRFRLARLWSNGELRKLAPLCSGRVINVSAGADVDKEGGVYANYFVSAEAYFLSNIRSEYRGFEGRDNEIELDLTKDIPSDLAQAFDVVFNHTTLEHVFEVRKAFRTLCELSRDLVIVVVPFAQVQHENIGYRDFWRFTPTCIRELFAENEMEVVYESANCDFNAATYLFFAASRHPDRWRSRLAEFKPLTGVGGWIGVTPALKGRFPSRLLEKLLRRTGIRRG